MMDRYKGKPFLRLLECYILNVVGQLDDKQYSALERMEPKLREVYKSEGSWVEVVAKQMEFTGDFHEQVRALWNRYSAHLKQQGFDVDSNQFVVRFVDDNFPQ